LLQPPELAAAPTRTQDDLAEPESDAGFGGAGFFRPKSDRFGRYLNSKRSKPATQEEEEFDCTETYPPI
jgi:hypothetical protein